MNKSAFVLLALCLTACGDPTGLAGSLLPPVTLNGSVNVPSTQVALIAQGGGNLVGNSGGTYQMLRLATEKGLGGVTVRFSGSKSATAVTDGQGNFKLELPAAQTFKVSASLTLKAGGTVTLSGYAFSDGLTPFELGTSMNLVSAKLNALGYKNPDGLKVKELVTALDTELATKASLPEATSESDAAAKFDATASAELQAKVKALAGK
jgi:hypothetical protein